MATTALRSEPHALAPWTHRRPGWSKAVPQVAALAVPGPDVADPMPVQGSDDEVWMVSYMDIMTLLLTLFVLLFVYTQAVAPESVAAEGAQRRVQRSEAKHQTPPVARVATPALLEADRPVALPPQWLGSLVEPPIPELLTRFDGAAEEVAAAASEAATMGPGADSGLVVERPSLPAPTVPVHEDAMPPSSGADDGAAQASRASSQLARAGQPTDAVVAEEPAMRLAGADGASRESPSVATGLAVPRGDVAVDTPRLSDRAPVKTGDAAVQPGRMDEALMAAIRASELGRRVEVTRRQDAVNLEIGDEILFDRGSAALKPGGEALLAELARLLGQHATTISVEGHTDNAPIRNARFASNWELSAARATNVTRQLIAHSVDPARVRAIGHADTKPRADNATAEGRARNRRVSLVLHVPAVAGAGPE